MSSTGTNGLYSNPAIAHPFSVPESNTRRIPVLLIALLLMGAFLVLSGCNQKQSGPPELTETQILQITKARTALESCMLQQTSGFHPGVALTAAAMSQLAYLPENSVAETLSTGSLQLVRYFDLQPADYQFFVARGFFMGRPQYVIAIRGSDSSEDWITNVQLANRQLKDITIPGRVHQGFLGYAESVYNQIAWADETRPMLYELMSGKADVLITGHSLGGAVALIYTAMLNAVGVEPCNMQTYTFGAPAVGDDHFSHSNDNGKIYRVEIQDDPVPFATLISPWMYSHLKRNLDEGENVENDYRSQFIHIGRSFQFDKESRGYTEKAAGAGDADQSFLINMANNVLGLWNSNYDVSAHMITTYIDTIDKYLQSPAGQSQMRVVQQ